MHPTSTRSRVRSGRILLLAGLACASLPCSASARSAEQLQGEQRNLFLERFEDADPSTGAMFRWWWPGAAVDAQQLLAEMNAIAAAGYKGVEIADVKAGVDYAIDPDLYQYGSPRWRSAVDAVTEHAVRLGLQVDMTLGPRWPVAVPGLDVDGPASSKELTYGFEVVAEGGYRGPVPGPEPLTYPVRVSERGEISAHTRTSDPVLVSVSAIRCVADCDAGSPTLDLGSAVDLSSDAEDVTLHWTPPDDGTWLIVGYWYRGTGQRNDAPFGHTPYLITDPESRVVDHFSREGASAFLEFFETTISTEALKNLSRAGGSLFEDSLELRGAQMWTAGMLSEFAARRGYSLIPYLACAAYRPAPGPFEAPSPAFAFADGDGEICGRVRRDLARTLGDLYLDFHLTPFREWAHRHGLTYRAQPYGEAIDLALAAAKLDIVEGESLALGVTDDWRLMASGAEAAGRTLVSDEMLPGGFGGSYRSTPRSVMREVNAHYAVGANQMVFHGFPYATWPPSADGSIADSAAGWPGFHGFEPLIPEAFGPRSPTWIMETVVSHYYARAQLVLQSGSRRLDLAVYNQSLNHVSNAFDGQALLASGYTYGYVTPGLLRLASARVIHGALFPSGPAFEAIVLDHQESLPMDTATSLLEFARSGLPIVVVGPAPKRVPGFSGSQEQTDRLDAELRALVADLLADSAVVRTTNGAALPSVLADLGIHPAATGETGHLRFVRRVDGETTFFLIFNAADTDVADTVSLRAAGTPFHLNAWTGEIVPVAEYTRNGDRILTPVSLQAGEATLLAIAPDSWLPAGVDASALHVVDTSADAVVVENGRLAVRAMSGGAYRSLLGNGVSVETRVPPLPAPVNVPTWNLAVDAYGPGNPGDASDVTRHTFYTMDEVSLQPWSAIPEIADASGVGTYTAIVDMPSGWSAASGAYLDLGRVAGSYQVRVNGQDVGPVNQLDTRVDIGPSLQPGANRIEVIVATNLNNALRAVRPQAYGEQARQDYGLIGPVTIRPYRVVPLLEPTGD